MNICFIITHELFCVVKNVMIYICITRFILGFKNVDWTVCTRCETFRPPRAHHCRICQRCIRRMDHHCPWINNCVGERNQKFFIQFLVYVGEYVLATALTN